MSNSIIKDKSFEFSLEVIKLYVYLNSIKNEFVLSKQLLRSGTSIGANVREGLKGQSRRDFLSKMSIALKEAEETEYWLELLILSNYLEHEQEKQLLENCRELCKILSSIVKTTKSNKLSQ
ncbi:MULTISPECIES: four helix bundle protein [unclassified Clostridium]|uniref:four helix bundle protein n=1 Tax=unclassified Clostridium TaxID=2614128 RepID=UPI0002976ED8|nr:MULTISPECIES: four helix bundle protein [unclassified Clostridium]EKQ56533.1 MAG: TIGR02436 family protein [Clostridium sp. Maddingley MBC34-26]